MVKGTFFDDDDEQMSISIQQKTMDIYRYNDKLAYVDTESGQVFVSQQNKLISWQSKKDELISTYKRVTKDVPIEIKDQSKFKNFVMHEPA